MTAGNLTLLEKVTNKLKFNGIKIATAESCTGGLLASMLTDLPGSSIWFERGFITYTNLSKQQLLAVPSPLLKEYGAVSIETAKAMAIGALKNSQADLAISITGIAGPSGGTATKPVGTVCFGWAYKDLLDAKLMQAKMTSRQEIRLFACNQALKIILSFFA